MNRFRPRYCRFSNGVDLWPIGPFYGLCGRRWLDVVFFDTSWGTSRPRVWANIFGTRYGCYADPASGTYVRQSYQLAKELASGTNQPGSCLPYYNIGTPYAHFKIDVVGAWMSGLWTSSISFDFNFNSPYVGTTNFESVATLENTAPDVQTAGDTSVPYVCQNFSYGVGGGGSFCGDPGSLILRSTVYDDGTFDFTRIT